MELSSLIKDSLSIPDDSYIVKVWNAQTQTYQSVCVAEKELLNPYCKFRQLLKTIGYVDFFQKPTLLLVQVPYKKHWLGFGKRYLAGKEQIIYNNKKRPPGKQYKVTNLKNLKLLTVKIVIIVLLDLTINYIDEFHLFLFFYDMYR